MTKRHRRLRLRHLIKVTLAWSLAAVGIAWLLFAGVVGLNSH